MTDMSVEVSAAAVARTVLRNPGGVGWCYLRANLSKCRRPHLVAALEVAVARGWVVKRLGQGYVPGSTPLA